MTQTELQRNPRVVIQNAKDTPVAVTARGKPVAYVISVDMFDEIMQRVRQLEDQEFKLMMELAERQFAAGDYVSQEALEREFDVEAS